MTTPIARLTAFRDYIIATDTSLNAYRFEQLCGLANGYFKSHASYNNKRGISSESIVKVKQAFPELNVEWVILGTGSMLTTAAGIPIYNIPFSNIPLTPTGTPAPELTPASHLSVTPYNSHRRPLCCYPVAAQKPETFACISSDMAMQLTIPPGIVIILTPMDIADITPAQLARPFAVILNDGSRLTRHLATANTRSLTFTPATTSPAYAPVKIQTKSVAHIFAITSSLQIFAPQP